MTKIEFILELKNKLSGLPQAEVDDRLLFYSEMIDDRIEDGMTEEAAVNDLGSIDEIASQIFMDTPLPKVVKATAQKEADSACFLFGYQSKVPSGLKNKKQK